MISVIYRYMPDLEGRICDSYEKAYHGEYCIIQGHIDDEVCMVKFSDSTVVEATYDELKDISFNGDTIAVVSK